MNNPLFQKLAADFSANESKINGHSKSQIHNYKKDAWNTLKSQGFPNLKHEEWKYTPLATVLEQQYEFGTSNPDITNYTSVKIKGLKANELYIVNGRVAYTNIVSEGITVRSVSEVIYSAEFFTQIQNFGSYKTYNTDGFIASNEAFLGEGFVIEVASKNTVSLPIVMYYITEATVQTPLSQPHNYLKVQKGGSITLIEVFHKIGPNAALTNTITEIELYDQACVQYIKILDEGKGGNHIGTTQVNQKGVSSFNSATFVFSGDVVRNNLNVALEQQGAEAHLFGLNLLDGSTVADNHTVVDHKVANCPSNETYKAVVDGRASSIFNGKIFVRPDAQKTNAYQSSKTLLLSSEASSNAKPQLEIWADDVKCSHGHATGQLDKDALFYFKARGIGEQQAKSMLTQAFALDIIEAVAITEIKEMLQLKVQERFN